MLTGLSAFPLTPMNETAIDEAAFVRLIERLVAAGVDSIGALGSTGNYAYLSLEERARVARLAVAHAGNVPVIVGISALRTRDVLTLWHSAPSSPRGRARGCRRESVRRARCRVGPRGSPPARPSPAAGPRCPRRW